MTTRVPSNWRVCATCAHWCGRAVADFSCSWVDFDEAEDARCIGGGFNLASTHGMASCTDWTRRFW